MPRVVLLIPLIKIGKVYETESQNIIDRVRQSIREDSSKGQEFSDLTRQINQALKTKEHRAEVNWCRTGKDFLLLGINLVEGCLFKV